MGAAAFPDPEAQRLATLLCLRILDTPPEERFDRITRLVAAHFNVPIAAINLIDGERQWTKAEVGLGTTTIPRAISLCAHAVLANDLLLVTETSDDERFRDNPLVSGAPHLRFYAGVPLRSTEGYPLGTLCVADTVPRNFSTSEVAQLHDFAAWAERELTTEQLSTALLRQQETEDALRLSEARYQAVIASLSEGIVLQDADGAIQTCNASAERILGLSADQMMGRKSIDPQWRAVREDGSAFPGEQHPAMLALSSGQAQENVLMGVHKPDASLTWISINAHPLCRPDDETPYGVVCSFVDITQRKQYEQQLTTYQRQLETNNAELTVLATTDGMTGVANKRMLLERLAVELRIAQRMQTPLALVMLDVDHFKAYNDSFGHPAGDIVLKHVAHLLKSNARSTDVVARYGGEEFVIVLPNTHSDGASYLAERFRTAIAQTPFPYRSVTASFGIAVVHNDLTTPDALIERADAALYEAKRQGRNTVVRAL